MKKKLFILAFIAFFALTSCDIFDVNRGIPYRYDIEYTEDSVDKESLDEYFSDNEELYPSYQELKSNDPDLLDNVKAINTGGEYKAKKMLRFSSNRNGFLDGQTFLFEDGSYYPLGISFGGFGMTEFLRIQGNAGHWIYYIYSYGSGIHRTEIRLFSLLNNNVYYLSNLDLGFEKDFTFDIDESDNTIDVYEATIHSSYDDSGFESFLITKGTLAFENIGDMERSIQN